MKNILKSQITSTKLISRLMTWSLLFLGVLTVCFVNGCRLFTVGG